jgi:hypothetical protein
MQGHHIECRKCGVSKSTSEFATYHNGKAEGVRKTCKACVKLEPRFPRTSREQREYGDDKKCSECKRTFPIEHFTLIKSTYNGRSYRNSLCRDCMARRRRERYATEEGREKIRDNNLKLMYGIGMDDYRRKHEQQNGLCAICGKPETAVRHGKVLGLAVDHSHVTSQVRDLLCGRCNKGIGCFLDDPQLLLAAVDYLKRHALAGV